MTRPAIAAALLRAGMVFPLAFATACTATPTGVQAEAETPAAAARDFYLWYLGSMAKGQAPDADAPAFEAHVSGMLRERLKAEGADGDPIDEDYFTKSQDYLDDWLDAIAVADARNSGDTAQVTVALGAGSDSWRLSVTLVREDGRWKIDRVDKR